MPLFVSTKDVAREVVKQLKPQLDRIERTQQTIMATQAEAAATLVALNDKITKIGTETSALLVEIQALKDAAANAPITPELQTAIDAVVARAQAVDDLVPDAPPTT